MIPADFYGLSSDLFVAPVSLTGESLPVEKVAATRSPGKITRFECDTLKLMGTKRRSETGVPW